MEIKCNHDLNIALNKTRDIAQLAEEFVEHFKEVIGGLQLSHKEGPFLSASMYMDSIWNYDHGYFQGMIDRHGRMNAEDVGCVVTGISELNKDDSSSEGSSMPDLQDRDRSDSSSSDDTNFNGDDYLYDDGEPWGCKEQTLKQIISGASDGISLAIDTPTLYALSLHGHAKVLTADIPVAFLHFDLLVDDKAKMIPTLKDGGADFCQAKE